MLVDAEHIPAFIKHATVLDLVTAIEERLLEIEAKEDPQTVQLVGQIYELLHALLDRHRGRRSRGKGDG
jgi:hypothetical protein